MSPDEAERAAEIHVARTRGVVPLPPPGDTSDLARALNEARHWRSLYVSEVARRMTIDDAQERLAARVAELEAGTRRAP